MDAHGCTWYIVKWRGHRWHDGTTSYWSIFSSAFFFCDISWSYLLKYPPQASTFSSVYHCSYNYDTSCATPHPLFSFHSTTVSTLWSMYPSCSHPSFRCAQHIGITKYIIYINILHILILVSHMDSVWFCNNKILSRLTLTRFSPNNNSLSIGESTHTFTTS